MPEAELVCVEGMIYVRTYDYLSTPEVIACDYRLSPQMSWLDWAWGSAQPEPLPIPLRRANTRYSGEWVDARPDSRVKLTFVVAGNQKAVRCSRTGVPCPKVRAGTETRWNGSYWQKWNKKRYDWEAI